MSEYSVEGVSATYIRSMETFGSVLSDLEDGRGQGWTHAGLEGFLTERMREVARQIFQDVMDSLSAGESRVEAVGSDGIARTRVESGHTRGLTTVFGPVTVSVTVALEVVTTWLFASSTLTATGPGLCPTAKLAGGGVVNARCGEPVAVPVSGMLCVTAGLAFRLLSVSVSEPESAPAATGIKSTA